MLPIKVTPVADEHIQKASSWWLLNRDKAPHAFKEELERGFAIVSQQPDLGAIATNVKLKGPDLKEPPNPPLQPTAEKRGG